MKQTEIKSSFDPNLGYLPPHSKQLEKSVLGSCMLNKNALYAALSILPNADFFYLPKNQLIYQAMLDLSEKSEPVDISTVSARLAQLNALEKVGGAYEVMNTTIFEGSFANIEFYCRKVQEAFIKRQIINICDIMKQAAFDPLTDAIDLLSDIQNKLLKVSDILSTKPGQSVLEILKNCLNEIHKKRLLGSDVTGIPSPLNSVNKITAGWQPSDLIILAARPAMGKTAFALHEALEIAKLDIPVGIIEAEMSSEQLVKRLISSETEIDSESLRRPTRLNDIDINRLYENTVKLAGCPLYIDDTASPSLSFVRATAAMWKIKYDIKILFVDYIQLLTNKEAGKNREQEIASITRGLKRLAKDLNIPVIALSQLSRGVELRESKKPMLSDLRESGSIEQDADLVMFLYREEYYEKEDCLPELAGVTEVIIAKHRNGNLDNILVRSILKLNKYKDIELNEFFSEDSPELYSTEFKSISRVNVIPAPKEYNYNPNNNLPESKEF